MKKLIAILLCIVFCLSLASCGEKKKPKPKISTPAASSSKVSETSSESKSSKSENSSSKTKKKKKKSTKKSSKTSKKTSSKSKSEPEVNSGSTALKTSNTFEDLLCNPKGWRAHDNSGQLISVTLNRNGSARAIVFDKKGVIVHDETVNNAWSLSGKNLTLCKAMSDAKDIGYKYTYKRIRDSVLESAPLEKADKKYRNCVPLESTGLKKNEFYVSSKYFCYYTGSSHGRDFCSLYTAN